MIPQKRQLPQTLSPFAPLSIIRTIWKRRYLALAIWIVAAALAAAFIRRMPNVYEARAVILVDSQKIPEKYVASTVQVSLQDSLMAISKQVLNSESLQRIIQDFKLYPEMRQNKSMDEMVERLKKELEVAIDHGFGGGPRPGAFRITYRGSDPKVVAAVVSRVTDLFIHENLETREERAANTSQFIESQLNEAKVKLEEQETSLSRYKVTHAGELPEQEGALSGALTRLQTQLTGCQDAINRAQQNKLMLESTLRFAESSLAASTRTASQPVVDDRKSGDAPMFMPRIVSRKSDVLSAKLEGLRTRYTDDHPEVRRAQAELQIALKEEARGDQAALGATSAQTANDPASTPRLAVEPVLAAEINRERERIHSTRTQLGLIEKELVSRAAEREQILREIAAYQNRIERLPLREQEEAALTRDYSASKMNYQTLLDKKISAEMASAMERSQQSERFTIADPARVPEKPVKPKRLILYAGSSVGMLFLGLAIGFLVEMKNNVFLGEWELPREVQVMGRISAIPTGRASVHPIRKVG